MGQTGRKKRVHTPEARARAVAEFLAAPRGGRKEVAERLGLSVPMLYRWAKAASGAAPKAPPPPPPADITAEVADLQREFIEALKTHFQRAWEAGLASMAAPPTDWYDTYDRRRSIAGQPVRKSKRVDSRAPR